MRKKNRRTTVAALFFGMAMLLQTAGCSSLNAVGGSRQALADWAAERGFAAMAMPAGDFDLAAVVRRPATAVETLTLYIEGDGAAWPTPYRPPRDPTPARPVSLALAAADPAPAVAYLGRPCQYLEPEALARCSMDYWTERRFAPEVVAAYDAAASQLKAAMHARRLRLVGYSGGGVIAALLAGRRDDVDALVTVAAPLALAEWTKWHAATPLAGSLDPAAAPPAGVAGVHFVGGLDRTVPAAIVERYARAQGGRVEVIPGFDHECCWTREWAALLALSLEEKAK